MSHIVASCKCHIDAYNKTICDRAQHTHTTPFTWGTHKVKTKQNNNNK